MSAHFLPLVHFGTQPPKRVKPKPDAVLELQPSSDDAWRPETASKVERRAVVLDAIERGWARMPQNHKEITNVWNAIGAKGVR